MKETRFIEQNKEKWLESEMLLKESQKDPEKLSHLFTQVVDDLSYSRTHYPNRSVRVYLNRLSREYFSLIYGHKKERKNRFTSFWLDEIPQIVIYARKPLILSLLIFILSATIGVFSAIKDPQFTSSILGEQYVTMTKANIEKGDPMAVYKEGHQVDMLLGITLNNLLVAFRTYVMGVFLSIGTIAILLYNGIMVGCFQYFFIERGLFAESALTIWLHGTLEISSIILAGGAGLTLGSGLIFPGTHSRLQAFQISAIRSLKLMLGITPIFVFAAIIESFLTRYTETPDFIRLLLIVLSAVFIIGYFVVYPWMKLRRGSFEHPLEEIRLPVDVDEKISFEKIKNNAEILKDSFLFYKKFINKILPWSVLTAAGMALANFILIPEFMSTRFESWWEYIFGNWFYGMSVWSPEFIAINAFGTGVIVYRVFSLYMREKTDHESTGFSVLSFGQVVALMALFYTMLYYLSGFGIFLGLITFLIFMIIAVTQHVERTNLFDGIGNGIRHLAANLGPTLGLQAVLLLMISSFLLILTAPLLYTNLDFLEWNFAKSDEWSRAFFRFIELFSKILALNLVIPIVAASAASVYFSLHEILTAENLSKQIEQVGQRYHKKRRK